MKYVLGDPDDRAVFLEEEGLKSGSGPAIPESGSMPPPRILERRFVALFDRADEAALFLAGAERIWADWHQPAIGDRYDCQRGRADYDVLYVEDAGTDGKYLCRYRRASKASGREKGHFTRLTALELNLEWVYQPKED